MSNVDPGKALKRLFTLPEPPKTPPAPVVSDAAVQQAAVEKQQRRNRARGFRSTILSQLTTPTESNGGAPLRTTIGS